MGRVLDGAEGLRRWSEAGSIWGSTGFGDSDGTR